MAGRPILWRIYVPPVTIRVIPENEIPPAMRVDVYFGTVGNMKFAYRNREFWCKGYYVDTVGKNTAAIKEYIANQLKKDKESEQLSIFDPRDPFTGSK